MTSPVKAYRAAILHSIADPAVVGVEQSYEYFEDGLLVIDNVEHVVEAAPSLADLLRACPRLHILASSRQPLAVDGEFVRRVRSLTVPHTGDSQALIPYAIAPLLESATLELTSSELDALTSASDVVTASTPA